MDIQPTSVPPQPQFVYEAVETKSTPKEEESNKMSVKPFIIVLSSALIIVPVVLLKQQCDNGWHKCEFLDFPSVSNTMGIFPNDKTYIFMMNLWTFV